MWKEYNMALPQVSKYIFTNSEAERHCWNAQLSTVGSERVFSPAELPAISAFDIQRRMPFVGNAMTSLMHLYSNPPSERTMIYRPHPIEFVAFLYSELGLDKEQETCCSEEDLIKRIKAAYENLLKNKKIRNKNYLEVLVDCLCSGESYGQVRTKMYRQYGHKLAKIEGTKAFSMLELAQELLMRSAFVLEEANRAPFLHLNAAPYEKTVEPLQKDL